MKAILLSKLDYEEKKDVYKQIKKEADIEKKLNEQSSRTGNKKQKKKNVMSLDQFNDLMNAGEESKGKSNNFGINLQRLNLFIFKIYLTSLFPPLIVIGMKFQFGVILLIKCLFSSQS